MATSLSLNSNIIIYQQRLIFKIPFRLRLTLTDCLATAAVMIDICKSVKVKKISVIQLDVAHFHF